MGNKNDNDRKKGKGKVIHFPELEDRARFEEKRKREEKHALKEAEKARKEREKLEEEYRRQYKEDRMAQSRFQANMARTGASKNGKTPFINWDKIPPFTRFALFLFVGLQIVFSFLLDDAQRFQTLHYFGFSPAFYTGELSWQWSAAIAPITSLLLHSGWMHLLFNGVMMLAMGVFFERQFGAKRTAVFFLLCGFAGHLTYLLFNPFETTPVIGASGAISGLFAVAILIMVEQGLVGPEAQRRGPFPFILLWVTLILFMGLIMPGTSWQSHLGGFLGGIGLFQLWKRGKIRL